MARTYIRGFVLFYGLVSVVMTRGASFDLMTNDLRPVLDVISRLATVKLGVQQGLSGSFGVCFSDSEAFKQLNGALGRFKGNASWLLVSRPPAVCLVAVPEETEVRSRQIASESQLKQLILQDVLPLSSFLEEELGVVGVPSKGIQVENDTPARSGVDNGPGGPTLLVSDPERYISSGFRSTSNRDRTIDFWMSEQELNDLYSVLHATQNVGNTPILKRASESTHENFVLSAKDVPKLRHECEIIAGASLRLRSAMQRVIRICDLAEADHLGIVVIGG
ncbi:MAG: hypothetical protein JO061_20010 [Acidobacteriaceae bacterium]|nr:hypothetical protein [Acidobacteriaceae bacterium]